ncbi:TetR family transcriptional regulator [Frondihabitans sp. PAMC 28766]|uniref:TetR/AcrR family transcriptional regulator n=1 Tax=Frondihabitans sp. PAMC 28766 TaxID=1795630 RepID=UPI00078EB8CA|nr:TetR/AcrR family transcriptional regulator [Frondihabitans sp. PAMC 28766]AMM18856.1 TetR family transcriptional regulator [Frondihabitans sp. PAMC 28766]
MPDASVAPGPAARGPYAKTAARRAAIIAAARDVFAAHGYRSGSIQEVATACGVSQSAVLHHFPAKEDLLLAVLADRDERGDDVSAGRGLVDGAIAQAEHNEKVPGIIELYTTLCAESVSPSHPAHSYFESRFARLRSDFGAQFRALADEGRLRPDVDPELAASGFVALWDGIQLQWLHAPDTVDVSLSLRHYLSLVLRP